MKPVNKMHAVQFPLRLPKSLKAAAKIMADRDDVSLNTFISHALAEKVARAQEDVVPNSRASEPRDPEDNRPLAH